MSISDKLARGLHIETCRVCVPFDLSKGGWGTRKERQGGSEQASATSAGTRPGWRHTVMSVTEECFPVAVGWE